ncbi:hypothetical protein FB472_1157 [Rhodoglobus vestalii]|uniref:Uncharacterized protein n=1 Tax=Rhodoglobus vestalii TaxID=193384 RepID=A0A8H2K3S2_9MICO|nr:hypothetical protein FB472_1157 [Rhodoglobus vestalii]
MVGSLLRDTVELGSMRTTKCRPTMTLPSAALMGQLKTIQPTTPKPSHILAFGNVGSLTQNLV